jgi:hypothetical protein
MVLGAATAGTVKADLMVVESKSRLAEIVGVLALATDLASGLQLEHGFRRTLIVL